MINNKNLYAGTMVLNEFRKELKALCDEYTPKLAEACPEDICGELWDDSIRTVRSIRILLMAKNVTADELISKGFAYERTNNSGDLFKKQINGINVTCCVNNGSAAKGGDIERVMKNIYAGVAALNEFKEKVKALCDEYTQKRAEACPENYASELWDEKDQVIKCVRIQFEAKGNNVTVDELAAEGFVYKRTCDTTDYYEKEIDGIEIVCTFDREVPAYNQSLAKEEKAKEVNSIIAGLREKYPLEDIKSILVAAQLKVINLIRCAEYLPEETGEAIIDESDLPF